MEARETGWEGEGQGDMSLCSHLEEFHPFWPHYPPPQGVSSWNHQTFRVTRLAGPHLTLELLSM